MKLTRRLFTLALALVLAAGLVPGAEAAGQVRVTLPAFPVTLGGQVIDPAGEEYPFLFYKDITYLPLTYFGCRRMGLYSKWTRETGLVISDAGAAGVYISTPRTSSNSGSLYATIAAGPITICGKVIDNSAERYPFLLFRDVTYLPMTWANMHDLLGCEYSFNGKKGLSITRRSTGGGSALYLPIYREGDTTGSIAAWRGWFWYQDDAGYLSRTPMGGGAQEQLYQIPIDDLTDSPALIYLNVSKDRLYMTYHLGGAIMGHDEQYLLEEDGSVVFFSTLNGALGDFGEVQLYANTYFPPHPGNLTISRDGGETWEPFGGEKWLYCVDYRQDADGGFSAGKVNTIVRAGNAAYMLGCDLTGWGTEEAAKRAISSCVVAVDLTTGETTPITGPAYTLFLAGGRLWYLTYAGELRHCNQDGTEDEAAFFGVDDREVTIRYHLLVDEDCIYATFTDEDGVNGIAFLPTDGGAGGCLMDIPAVWRMSLEDGYLTVITKDSATGEMGLMVLHNPLGNWRAGDGIIYQNSGPDYLAAGVSDGKLYYVLK